MVVGCKLLVDFFFLWCPVSSAALNLIDYLIGSRLRGIRVLAPVWRNWSRATLTSPMIPTSPVASPSWSTLAAPYGRPWCCCDCCCPLLHSDCFPCFTLIPTCFSVTAQPLGWGALGLWGGSVLCLIVIATIFYEQVEDENQGWGWFGLFSCCMICCCALIGFGIFAAAASTYEVSSLDFVPGMRGWVLQDVAII